MPPVPKAKGKGKGLGKKLGPLPLWAWIIIAGVGGYFGYQWYKNRAGGGGTPTTAGPSITPTDMASSGQPSSATAPASQLDQSTLDALAQQEQASFGSLANQLQNLPDEISKSLAYNFGGSWSGGQAVPPNGGTGGGDNGSGGVNNPPSGGPDMSWLAHVVSWGGQLFTSKEGLAAYLNNHGGNYATWAAQHPSAWSRLTGPLPTAAKPSSHPGAKKPPVHTSSKPHTTPQKTHHAPPKKNPPRTPPKRTPPRPAAGGRRPY